MLNSSRMTKAELAAATFSCGSCGRQSTGLQLAVWDDDPDRGAAAPKFPDDAEFDGLTDFSIHDLRCICGAAGPRLLG